MKQVLACGLFRSGTNFCQQLVEANFEVERPDLYKHAHGVTADKWDQSVSLIHVWKTPAQWVDSLMRNSYDLWDCYDVRWVRGHDCVEVAYRLDGEHWSTAPLHVPVSLQKVARLYNNYWRYWMLRLPIWPGGSVVIHHKKLAFCPYNALNNIRETLGLDWNDKMAPVTDVGEVYWSPPFRPELYLDETTLEHLTSDQAELVDSLISDDVKEYLDGH